MKDKKMFFVGAAIVLSFGWIVFPYILYKPVNQPIQFSHAAHTGDNVGLKCESCHVFDKDGRFFGIPSVDKCRSCHLKPMGISKSETILAQDYVSRNREIPWIIYSKQPQNVFFSHATHVRLGGIACQTCHFGQAYSKNLRPAYFSRISGYSLDIFGKDLLNFPSTPRGG